MQNRATREALEEGLLRLGESNDRIMVIDCDVSKSCKTAAFQNKFPKQHINVGIAEQNAVGIAAGLATTGKIPFVVTYAVFGSMRALEQMRQEACYPRLNVKMLCSHGGLTPANDGASHQCIEDMGILRTIPNMTVVMPADYESAIKLIEQAADYPGPVYLRFTRDPVPEIYPEEETFAIGKAKRLTSGKDVAILANGDTVSIALEAEKLLRANGIEAMVYDFHTIKPLDSEAVLDALFSTGRIITVEDHNVINGLGSAVCEIVAQEGRGMVRRIGVKDQFGESAPYHSLLCKNGITPENIVKNAMELIKQTGKHANSRNT